MKVLPNRHPPAVSNGSLLEDKGTDPMPLTKCKTCNTEFDATPRCPDCRQMVPDAAVEALAQLTAAVTAIAPHALAATIFMRAKKK